MKKLFVLLMVILIVGCGKSNKQVRDVRELKKVEGRFYLLEDVAGYTGQVIQYSEDFPDRVVGKADIKDGLIHGKVLGYDNNGVIMFSQIYKEGLLHGKTLGYNSNGIVTYERNYYDGYSEGPYRVYYTNGKLKYEENYRKDKVHGKTYSYSKDGILEEERLYENGELKDKKSYIEEEKNVEYIFSVDRNQSNVIKGAPEMEE